MSEASRQRHVLGFLPSSLIFHYLIVEATGFTVENEAQECGQFAWLFLIINSLSWLCLCFLTLGWFSFSGTKGKCFQISTQKAKSLKGDGLFSAFLKNKKQHLRYKNSAREPPELPHQCLVKLPL